MSIAAGFKCADGIVMCADTQETVEYAKTNVPKLRFESVKSAPVGGPFKTDHANDLAVAFAGASNSGPFIDKVVDNAWSSAQTATSLDEVCSDIESSIKKTHAEYGRIFQPGYLPHVQLMYGVKMHGSSKLFSAQGPIVNEVQEHGSHGVGFYLANYISTKMYSRSLTLRQLVILAAYCVFQAKLHIDGCGGATNVAVLDNRGHSHEVEVFEIDWLEKHSQALFEYDELLIKNADLALRDDILQGAIDHFLLSLKMQREDYRAEKQRFTEFLHRVGAQP